VELVCLLLIATLAVGFCVLPFPHAGRYTGTEVNFGGFGREALVAICCLMILGRGLIVTGALEPAARSLARLWQWSAAARLLSLDRRLYGDQYVRERYVGARSELTDPSDSGRAREISALEDSDAGQLRNFSSRHGDHDRHLEQYARCFIARELGQPPLDVFSFFSLMAGCRS